MPDRYDPTGLGETPKREEYHSGSKTARERPKVAGGSRGSVKETSGTDNIRANQKTKSARIPDVGTGRKKTPAAVDSYDESGRETV